MDVRIKFVGWLVWFGWIVPYHSLLRGFPHEAC